MKRLLLAVFAAACLAIVGVPLHAQVLPVYKTFTLTSAAPTFTLAGLNGQSNCAVTIASGSTFGGGTLHFSTSADNGATYTATTGIPDLGNPSSGGSQTTTSAPSRYTVPVAAQTNLQLSLAGSTGASVSGVVNCNAGVARIGGGGGGGGAGPLTPGSTDIVLDPDPITAAGSIDTNKDLFYIGSPPPSPGALPSGTLYIGGAGQGVAGAVISPPPSGNGFVVAWTSPPPSRGAQASANINIDGTVAFGSGSNAAVTPAPTVSEGPGYSLTVGSTGSLNPVDYYDPGTTTQNIINWRANNQGGLATVFTVNSGSVFNAGVGAYNQSSPAPPPTPVPTCSPGGSNAQTTYFVKVNYVNGGNGSLSKGVSSGESTVTCAPNTLLTVPAPPGVKAGINEWTVSASLTTNTEKEQTQGTSPTSGVGMPLSTLQWVSTATLAGSTSASTTDNTIASSQVYHATFANATDATPGPLCGPNNATYGSCRSNGNGPETVAVATTSPASCTANVECLQVTANFGTNFTANPKCPAPGIQDSTTSTDIWVGSIASISVSSVVFNLAPTTTTSGSKSLTVNAVCELF